MSNKEYITPYYYELELNIEEAERDDECLFIIYYNGQEIKSSSNILRVGNPDMLSKEEFIKKFEGTRGIKDIHGVFKNG